MRRQVTSQSSELRTGRDQTDQIFLVTFPNMKLCNGWLVSRVGRIISFEYKFSSKFFLKPSSCLLYRGLNPPLAEASWLTDSELSSVSRLEFWTTLSQNCIKPSLGVLLFLGGRTKPSVE